MGRIIKKVLVAPEMTGTPDDDSEVTIRWQGKLLPSGTLFQKTTTQTFKMHKESLSARPPWWKVCLQGNPGGASGGRGMGDGETAQFTIPPECAYGDVGDAKRGIPPNASLFLKVTLIQYASYEDISPKKDGTCVRKIERRGMSEDTPRKGDECIVHFRISNVRTKEVYHEVPDRMLIIGELPDRQREAMRLMSEGAFVDRAIELLLCKMHTGEKNTARCTQAFVGGSGDDVEIKIELKEFVKLLVCPKDGHPLGSRAGRIEVGHVSYT